jgi:hypothetical protein
MALSTLAQAVEARPARQLLIITELAVQELLSLKYLQHDQLLFQAE